MAVVPTIRTFFFVETPRSSRYTIYLRHATIFVLADPHLGSIHRSSPIHCSQGLSIYRPPIISSSRPTHLRAYVAYEQQRDPRLASEQQPSYLSSSTDCALQQFGASCSCHGSYPALWPDSTKVWGVLKMLFTAYQKSVLAFGSPSCNKVRAGIYLGRLYWNACV